MFAFLKNPPRWLISIAVMLATIMVILDMTIVNVSLPHMMGALGATADQTSWVLTSYIVVEAMMIPLTGFFSARFGRRRLLITSISGFVIASALCGQAESLIEMVLFRLLQGAFGAPVIPLSQAIMADVFGRERGKGMALWGIGVMLGPIMGPTIGGLITEYWNWRWVFYINVPIGLINLLLISASVPITATKLVKADFFGAFLMMAGIGCLQVVLDRGNQDDWFNSEFILLLTTISVSALSIFVARGWNRDDTIVRIRLLANRNLAISCIMISAFGIGMFGTIALQPLMLERLLGYSAGLAGMTMSPRGIGAAISMLVISRLIGKVDARKLILTGLMISATGSSFMTLYNLEVDTNWIIWPAFVQGLGMGFIFVPLSTLAYDTVPREFLDQATSIYNLLRTLGTSAGISLLTTILARTSQISWNELGSHIDPYNPALNAWLGERGLTLNSPGAPQALAGELYRQSNMVGFVDAFLFVTLSYIFLAPLLLLLKKSAGSRRPAGGH